MAEFLHKNNVISAKVTDIENDSACLAINNNNQEVIHWPLSKLPEGIEIGDVIGLNIEFELAEQRKEELKKKALNEAKYTEMRKMLEELVN